MLLTSEASELELALRYAIEPSRGPLPGDTTCSSAFQMQCITELHFFATVGEEQDVELALV